MAFTDKVESLDFFELLHKNTTELESPHEECAVGMTNNETKSLQRSVVDDFLDTLLDDPSSAPASPLWSPCFTDSSTNEDPVMDPSHNPDSPSCSSFSDLDVFLLHQPPVPNQPSPDDRKSDVSIDLDWGPASLHKDLGIAYYLTKDQNSLLPPNHTLSVKDLLISNLGQKMRRIPQHSLQELILNEDEKKLLAKEGVKLPSKLPLSKFEERVLKKIRRKIRNKRSAQESRKKKREYVDSLEGRMSACSAHNLELQRKIQHLEETNTALLEQLSRLQALIPNHSSKTMKQGTCILVFLLSFSLFISSSLQPDLHSRPSRAEYAKTQVSSRSLQSIDEGKDVPPMSLSSIFRGFEALQSLAEKLWAWKELSAAALFSSRHQEHNHRSNYHSQQKRKM